MTQLLIFTALLIKHFICDFPLQREYQWKHKGTYGHPGGVLHAAIHGAGTVLALLWFAPILLVIKLAVLDALIHYHIDWAKNKINRKYGLTPTNGSGFWFTFGLDQLLHQMTYIAIVCIIIRS